MWELRTALFIAALLSTTDAFILDFNSLGQCTGATIGEFVGSVGSGCQTHFSNVSDSNILIPVEGGSDNVLISPNIKVNPTDKTSAVAVSYLSDSLFPFHHGFGAGDLLSLLRHVF